MPPKIRKKYTCLQSDILVPQLLPSKYLIFVCDCHMRVIVKYLFFMLLYNQVMRKTDGFSIEQNLGWSPISGFFTLIFMTCNLFNKCLILVCHIKMSQQRFILLCPHITICSLLCTVITKFKIPTSFRFKCPNKHITLMAHSWRPFIMISSADNAEFMKRILTFYM